MQAPRCLAPSATALHQAPIAAPTRCLGPSRHSRLAWPQLRQRAAPSWAPLAVSPVCTASEQTQRPGTSPQCLQSLSVPVTGMAKNLGSRGGGATLQRSKLDLRQKQQTWEPKLDSGNGGGGIGKGIFNGGGGGDDGGDDDDYFNEGEDGDDDDGSRFFKKVFIGENYAKEAIFAVLSEWFRTPETLPLILRQAVQMGLFSSQQLVRFLALDNRPTVTRAVQRSLPTSVSRGLVGRMMADPAFVQKLLMESVICTGSSLLWEAQQRGERFSKELDLVAINTLSLLAANAALVWSVAPSRSFGSPQKMPWQRMLAKLPNHAFDSSGPQRVYTHGTRAASYVAKIGELAAVGAVAGGVMSALGNASTALRRRADPSYQPSVAAPALARSAGGLALFMGVSSNTRYQLVAGMDTYLFGHSNFLWSYLALSGVMRLVSNAVSSDLRLQLQGLPRGDHPAPLPQLSAPRQQQMQRAVAAAAAGGSGATAAGPARPKTKKRVTKKKVDRGFAMSAGMS